MTFAQKLSLIASYLSAKGFKVAVQDDAQLLVESAHSEAYLLMLSEDGYSYGRGKEAEHLLRILETLDLETDVLHGVLDPLISSMFEGFSTRESSSLT